MTKAAALALVESSTYKGCWSKDAEYAALAATSTWAEFMTILKKNSLWMEDGNALAALKKVYDAA